MYPSQGGLKLAMQWKMTCNLGAPAGATVVYHHTVYMNAGSWTQGFIHNKQALFPGLNMFLTCPCTSIESK